MTKVPSIDEAQAATGLVRAAANIMWSAEVFQTCVNRFPQKHEVNRLYRKVSDSVQVLRRALQREVERQVEAGAELDDDNWWMVHPDLQPPEFRLQERPTQARTLELLQGGQPSRCEDG